MNVRMTIFTNWFELIALHLALIVFVGCVIAYILSFFIRRINRKTINIVAVVSFIVLVFFAMAIPSSVRAPGPEMSALYSSASHGIILGNYPGALETLYESNEWAQYVPDDSESEILKNESYYLGGIDYLISCLDGGSLSATDLQFCTIDGNISTIGYLWIKRGQHIILNIYPSGMAYLATETGYYGKISDILGEQFDGSNYSLDIKRENPHTDKRASCWKYQSYDMISNIAKAVALDQFFAYKESNGNQPKGKSWEKYPYPATDYFTISCRGNQINDYWNTDAEGNPPWNYFRQVALDIVKAALNTGTEITAEEYMQALQEAEDNSGVQILTGYNYSKMVVAAYKY